MKLGFIILAHRDLGRVEQLVRHLAAEGCAVAVHIDKQVPERTFDVLRAGLADCESVVFSRRTTCEWGRFSLVQATLDAAKALLEHDADLDHVCLISGSCLPIRPIRQMRRFLARSRGTDFIESVSVANNIWVKDGLNEERFTLYFPFSWRRQRRLFDRFVDLQRLLGVKRKMPQDLVPHIGSQWWCLTAKTLRAILNDPRRAYFDNYFKSTWIPDESYFQTLARLHGEKIENRSLTFSKFDYLGRPFVLYDDHLNVLSQSDCFMARKIWAGADRLYEKLLDPKRANQPMSKADPAAFAAMFDEADRLRCEGGLGRFHQGRFPFNQSKRTDVSAAPFSVFIGFKGLFAGFPAWVRQETGTIAYGSLFARGHVGGRPRDQHFAGNLPAEPRIRNRNAKGYLSNVLWPHRHRHQSFLWDFRDHPAILKTLAYDPKATVVLVRHAWLLNLLGRDLNFDQQLSNARRYHRLEQRLLAIFAEPDVTARLETIPLEQAIHDPATALNRAIGHMGGPERKMRSLPERAEVDGLDNLVRRLRNNGLPLEIGATPRRDREDPPEFQKPYVVK